MPFNFWEFLKSLFDLTVFDYLRSVWGNPAWAEIVFDIVAAAVITTVAFLGPIILGWAERKIAARMQDRIGPNRVGGKYGILQTIADVVKMITKELIVPKGVDKPAYFIAPVLIAMTGVLMFAVLPFAPGVIGANLNIGIFYALAVSSVSVVAMLLAGWGSNNKYALLGAFRAVAQLVSYEVPMILGLLVPILLAHSMSTVDLVNAQTIPFLLIVPLSGVVFFISVLAESGRAPFDLVEAESEIVAGFHIEYSGMNYGLVLASEYISAIFMSGLFVTVYLGGYRLFGLETITLGAGFQLGRLLGLIIFLTKTVLIFFVLIWVRATLPRVRIDQLLNFNWKFMVPLSLALIFTAAILDKVLPLNVTPLARAGAHFISNILIGFVTISLLRQRGRRQRQAHEMAVSAS